MDTEYRCSKHKKRKPLTEEQKAKRREKYLANRERLAKQYADDRTAILQRAKDNRTVRQLERIKDQLLEIQKSTINLEIKQFINLILTSPALFNIGKHTIDFLKVMASDFPYPNGSSHAVLSALDMLRREAEEDEQPSNELVYDDEPELNIYIT